MYKWKQFVVLNISLFDVIIAHIYHLMLHTAIRKCPYYYCNNNVAHVAQPKVVLLIF